MNGRKLERARTLRRSNNDLTLEQPRFRRAGGPTGTPIIRLETKSASGQIDPPADQSADADAADRAWILPASETPHFAV